MKVELVPVEKLLNLRHKVLRPHRPMSEAHFDGDNDPSSFHVAVLDEKGEAQSIASIVVQEPPVDKMVYQGAGLIFRLRGMATAPECQGQGFGRLALLKIISECDVRGGELLWCHARIKAVSFYEKMGFITLPTLYEVVPAGLHRFSYFQLSLKPKR